MTSLTQSRCWWIVKTDHGTVKTFAASPAGAARNARYRLVMDGRSYARPTPRDLAAMRDIEVVDVKPAD